MKILVIAATHGNELLGIQLYERLLATRSPVLEHLDFIIGNPKAYARGVRYVEYDLNRVYGKNGRSYEHKRSREIERYIADTTPDIVLDMHTTNCIQPACLIVHNLADDTTRQYLRASHISHILQVTTTGDIATLDYPVIGYEVSRQQVNTQSIDKIIADMKTFIDSSTPHVRKRLYKMYDTIRKNEVTLQDAETFINFEPHMLGYVPIMTGENSYKHNTNYLGFKAYAPEEITV